MLYGIGVDIVDISRIAKVFEKYQDRFVKKIVPSEDYHQNHTARSLSKAFAAKEAFSKSMGTGCRYPLLMSLIGIRHDHLGKPYLIFYGPLQDWVNEKKIKIHLSFSDTESQVVAFVVVESLSVTVCTYCDREYSA